ncbi:hypothetical protein SmJEL517_g06169 [Synchytrium microbalum]|uniref:Uncharacterized protein n=1 Tax=Synchytrium microbalum TaxID=1806994 RepID=A0A507BJU2_9FUNG|nr:uncharacterized protein SmJEL517_g06169 [Synchytrium microbalum]TPX30207.1 hypothetical protein SmJEL517_g06169 [Synchytrium microbalum]
MNGHTPLEHAVYGPLPPCAYPSARPYSGFTTLLHRFSQYERARAEIAVMYHDMVAETSSLGSSIELSDMSRSSSMDDQRVALTDRQVIKLEVGRLGAAVERLNKARITVDKQTATSSSTPAQKSPTSPESMTFNSAETLHKSMLRHAPSEREKMMFISDLVQKLDSRRRYENQAAVMRPKTQRP